MRILLMNQYGAGDPAPTARLLQDLAGMLESAGWTVDWAVDRAPYHKRKTGWRRWLKDLLVHLSLLRQGLIAPTPDVVLSLTSPVCLAVTASLLARFHGARHIHWAMDLYPDLALALGEVREGPFTRCIKRLMRMAYQSSYRVVALDEDMREYLSREYGVHSDVIAPWPDDLGAVHTELPPQRRDSWTWLYSGNLGRAHEWETLLEVQRLLETEQHPACLVFQGDGVEMVKAREKAEGLGLQRCFFRSYASKEMFVRTLLEASVLVVTRKPALCGLLWPSKLALLEQLPRPLLWVGDTEGKAASGLKSRPQTGVFAPGQTARIKQWLLDTVVQEPLAVVRAVDPSGQRSEGMRCWRELLEKGSRAEGLASGKRAVESKEMEGAGP